MFPPLPNKKFAILLADPPYDYKGQKQHNGPGGKDTGGAILHYSTVKLSDLKTLDVPSICEKDCLLFLWVTNPHLDQGIELLKHWGFKWATVGFVWNKEVTNPGYYTLSQCELCLIGKRGKIPRPRGSRKVRQLVSEHRRFHSQKPDAVRQRIMEMFPTQTKIELFAREQSEGWASWGKDLKSLY